MKSPATQWAESNARDIQKEHKAIALYVELVAALRIALDAIEPLIEDDPHPLAQAAYDAVTTVLAKVKEETP